MQMDLGETGLQPPQEVFVELHPEIGMDAALEKDPGSVSSCFVCPACTVEGPVSKL